MTDQTPQTHAMAVLAELIREHGWSLTPEMRQRYVDRALAALGGDAPTAGDLRVTLSYYHSERDLVEALRSPDHPGSQPAWETLTQHVRHIVTAKARQIAPAEITLSLEDLTQEALGDIWRGLPHFRYQSRFQTWVFAVISHCLNRSIRHISTQKRRTQMVTTSLDRLQDHTGAEPPDEHTLSPDEAAQARVLLQLVAETLARHPDRRLADIVRLWAIEQYTLREIGAQLNLSVGRVHALQALAHALLRAEPSLRHWKDEEA